MMQLVIAIILLILVFNTSSNSGSGQRNADKTAVLLTDQDGFLLETKVV
jgi:hypothetical protein